MRLPYTENAKAALITAEKVAGAYGSGAIGTEHILYGLVATERCTASKILRKYGVDTSNFDGEHMTMSGGFMDSHSFTSGAANALVNAERLAMKFGKKVVGTEQILYCLLLDPSSAAGAILGNLGVDQDAILGELEGFVSGEKKSEAEGGEGGDDKQLPTELSDLGIDLTKKARENKLDPIIGRKEEIERIIQILCRKTKNNPVLIGEPGVGKSAVVEGLARAIVEGNVPELLKNKMVFALDIGSLVAGTKYRGALEEKLKGAIDLIRKQGNIIVFIDELHTLAQAGSKEGEVSPADILKPYLARGELQTIGATTTEEYRKFIEKDKALERRFQPIIVAPPSVDDTIEILKGLKENYEAFHKVKISDDAIVAAAKLSDRYITDRFLPDKAIDLIDEAMSRVKVSSTTVPESFKQQQEKLENIKACLEEAVKAQDFEKAGQLKRERDELTSRMSDEKVNWAKANEQQVRSITADDIAEIVSKWTKIPVNKLNESESDRLMKLEEILHKRVIGQDEAIKSVARAIRRARAGLKDPSRPIGSFLFLGPTGVGKTELTKALSEAMFDDENAIIRLDMSEYMESHSVSKLIGAPPGYVGFDDGGQLTEQVRRKPYSVVLFDEIEKAHPDVYNIMLQILDDGRLTDGQGRTVDFKNTIIIMTSNVGVAELKNTRQALGFSEGNPAEINKSTDEVLGAALKRHFKPEFLNRIDVICFFHSLTADEIKQIAGILIRKFEKTLKERNITLQISDAAMDYIVKQGYDIEYGARPLRRVIEQKLEDNIAEGIIDRSITDNSTVSVDFDGEGITINGKRGL